jgi:hypothetical protein
MSGARYCNRELVCFALFGPHSRKQRTKEAGGAISQRLSRIRSPTPVGTPDPVVRLSHGDHAQRRSDFVTPIVMRFFSERWPIDRPENANSRNLSRRG